MNIERLVLGELFTNCYIVWEEETGNGVVIDPADDAETVAAVCRDKGVHPRLILATHGHFDHIGAAAPLKETWHIPFCIHTGDAVHYNNMRIQAEIFGCRPLPPPPAPDVDLAEEKELSCGGMRIEVIPTPGHSQGSVTFRIYDHLFCGDLLFRQGVGRTDLPGGNAEQLAASVRDRIFTRESGTLHPGHGPVTTVERERETNPFFGTSSALS